MKCLKYLFILICSFYLGHSVSASVSAWYTQTSFSTNVTLNNGYSTGQKFYLGRYGSLYSLTFRPGLTRTATFQINVKYNLTDTSNYVCSQTFSSVSLVAGTPYEAVMTGCVLPVSQWYYFEIKNLSATSFSVSYSTSDLTDGNRFTCSPSCSENTTNEAYLILKELDTTEERAFVVNDVYTTQNTLSVGNRIVQSFTAPNCNVSGFTFPVYNVVSSVNSYTINIKHNYNDTSNFICSFTYNNVTFPANQYRGTVFFSRDSCPLDENLVYYAELVVNSYTVGFSFRHNINDVINGNYSIYSGNWTNYPTRDLMFRAWDDDVNYCPYCGDGTVDEDEECDDGNVVGGDGCASDCTNETSSLFSFSNNNFYSSTTETVSLYFNTFSKYLIFVLGIFLGLILINQLTNR